MLLSTVGTFCLLLACDLRPVGLLECQIRVGKHDQGDMTVKSRPETAFIIVQAKLAFGILVETLDYPPQMGEIHQFFERQAVQSPGEVILGVASAAGQRSLAHQPKADSKRCLARTKVPYCDTGTIVAQIHCT